jgi:hypothetical protein
MATGRKCRYFIDSNKQSGFGRYDIMLVPKDLNQIGYIIEFKAFNKRLRHRDLDQVARDALQQIEDRKYQVELLRRGVTRLKKLAIVFKGQLVKIVEG